MAEFVFKFFFGVPAAAVYLCLLGFKYFYIVYSLQYIVFILLKPNSLQMVSFVIK